MKTTQKCWTFIGRQISISGWMSLVLVFVLLGLSKNEQHRLTIAELRDWPLQLLTIGPTSVSAKTAMNSPWTWGFSKTRERSASGLSGYNILLISASGGAPTKATQQLSNTDEYNPFWSPDGSHLGQDVLRFSGNVQAGQDLYITNVASGVSSSLSGAEGGDNGSYSPDGRRIALNFISNLGIYVLPATGGTANRLVQDGSNPSWSPDGSKIVFEFAGDLWTIPVAGGATTRLTSGGDIDYIPKWSPDGNWVAFTSNRSGNSDVWKIQVNASGGPAGNPIQVTITPDEDGGPTWSPNSQRLAFHSNRSGNFDIWTISASGGAATQVTTTPENDFDPAWSPDGTTIAFASNFVPAGTTPFRLHCDGFSALVGASSATGLNLLAVAGQAHPIGTSSNSNHILKSGFIPCITQVGPPVSSPVVNASIPNSGQQGQTLNATITGANFVTGATVAFSGTGITVNNANVNSAIQISANISIAANALAGPRDVIVTNPDGKIGTGAGLFRVSSSGAEIKPVVAGSQAIGVDFVVDIAVSSVQNLFGVSFELNFTNTNFIDVVTPHNNNVTSGDFLGNDVIFFQSVDEAAGKVNIGISRKTGQPGVNGTGVLARVKFKSLTSTPPGTQVLFSLNNVVANDPAGNSITLQAGNATVTLSGILVWPGDTNNDKIVNQADVLPLGLFFTKTGPPRQNATINWIGQPATPWTPEAATYADANGDGAVNQADVLAIGFNFGKTHTSANPLPLAKAHSTPSAATLKPDVNPPQQAPGKEFFIRIRASDVTDLFGLSFELLFDKPALLQIQAVEPDSLMGHDVIFFSLTDAPAGKVSVGMSRKAGQSGVSGAGSVVRIKAMITTSARNGEVINLSLQNVAANNSAGQALTLALQSAQIVVMTTAVAAKSETQAITAYQLHQNYPNPFNPSTLIHYEIPRAGQVVMKVYNFVGQEVRALVNQVQSPGAYHISWDGRDEQGRAVPSGIYLYRLQAGSFVETRKMILLR